MSNHLERSAMGWLAVLVATVLPLSLGACHLDDPCSPGQEEVRGTCVPIEEDAGPDASDVPIDEDAGPDASDIVQCEPTGSYDAFGIDCEDQSDCACPAGTCAEGQGDYCTELNCMRTDEDGGTIQVCPPEWTCQSLEGLPGVPPGVDSICIRQ
ncbi:MAG: hypothetical protein ACODAU_07095 [Myxococcota bacterium]